MKSDIAVPRARRRIRSVMLLGVALAATSALVSCSSSGGSNPPNTGTASAGGAGSGAAPVDNAAAVTAAKAFVSKWSARPTELTVPSLPSKPERGKTVDYIQCGAASCEAFGDDLKSAAAAVGWNIKVLDAGFTPQTQAAAYTQAVRDNPAGVIGTGGVDPHPFARQIAQLKAKGIPVILHGITEAQRVPGVTAVGAGSSAPYFNFDGVLLGNAILADAGGRDVHIAYMGTPAITSYNATRDGIKSVLERSGACKNCSSAEFSFPVTDIGPNLPSKIVSYLRSHPEVNYVDLDFLDLTSGVPAALTRAGLASKVKIVTNGVSPVQIEYLKNDQLLAASVNPWPETMYYDMTVVLAASMKADLKPYIAAKLPSMLLTKSSLFPVSANTQFFPLVADYKDIYAKAWKIG